MSLHQFDLQSRAKLGILSLTRLPDQQRDGLMYFLASWQSSPPRAIHCLWDYGDGSGRHIDALTLAGLITNSQPLPEVIAREKQIEAWMVRQLGQEGLTWIPSEPWARPWGQEMLLASESISPSELLAEISWSQRGTLLGITSRWLATGDEKFLNLGMQLIQGFLRISKKHSDGLFFPEGYYRSNGWRTDQPSLFPGIEEVNAAILVPLSRFYAASKFLPALELATGIARYALKHSSGYSEMGEIQGGALLDHFHTRTNFILGILEVGIISHQQEYIDWARKAYEQIKNFGTEFGWFPEGIGCRHGEICATVDMLEIALQLGRWVDPGYFADAEKYGRNHLLESQFLSINRLRKAVSRLPDETVSNDEITDYSTIQGVLESQKGGFAARSTLNDAFHLDATAMMQCCNASGVRGLYDLWRYAIQENAPGNGERPVINIHLRFSNERQGLRLVSHEPLSGKLTLTSRKNSIIRVRLPSGERQANLIHHETGASEVLEASNGYVSFGMRPRQSVELVYPVNERHCTYLIGAKDRLLACQATWKGETVMTIDPPGMYYPLYERHENMIPAQPVLPPAPLINSLA